MFENLLDPVDEIRLRALDNAESKLKLDLLSQEEQSCLLRERLTRWLRHPGWPNATFWSLVHQIHANLANNDRFKIDVEQFKSSLKTAFASCLSDDPNCQHLLEELGVTFYEPDDRPVVPRLTLFEDITDEDIVLLTPSQSESARATSIILDQSLPPKLLASCLSTDRESKSQFKTPVRTPVQYFDRRVQFQDATDANDELSLNDPSFSWVFLGQVDRQKLHTCSDLLSQDDYDSQCQALDVLEYELVNDMPAPIWLQRPIIFHSLLEIHTYSSDSTNRTKASRCLNKIAEKLSGFWAFQTESFIHSQSDGHSRSVLDTNATRVSEEPSYQDEIDVMYLKDQRITVLDFLVLSLSSLATSTATVSSVKFLSSSQVLMATLTRLGSKVDLCRAWESQSVAALTLQEVLRDICHDFMNALKQLKKQMNSEQGRTCYFLLLEGLTDFVIEFFPPTLEVVDALVKEMIIADPTLAISHQGLFKRVKAYASTTMPDFMELSELLRDFGDTLQLVRGTSRHPANHVKTALSLVNVHECPDVIQAVVKQLKNKMIQPTEKSELASLLLQVKNPNLRTQAYLGLHGIVQDELGISRAFSTERSTLSSLAFLFQDSRPLTIIVSQALSQSDANHISRVSQDIVLYLLKARSENRDLTKVLTSVLPLLECFTSQEGALSIFLWKLLNPEASNSLEADLLLTSNLRLLFSSSQLVRRKAMVNLRYLLAKTDQESESGSIPTFEDALGTDFTDSMVAIQKVDLVADQSSNLDASHLVQVMENISTERSLKSSLVKLKLLLQDCKLLKQFFELQGIAIYMKLFKKLFNTSTNSEFAYLLHDLLSVAHILCKNPAIINQHVNDFANLFFRCIFLEKNDNAASELAATTFLLLFQSQLTTAHGRVIHIQRPLREFIDTPFKDVSDFEEDKSEEDDARLISLLVKYPVVKAYWNIGFFEDLSAITARENQFSRLLTLNASELELIKSSFPEDLLKSAVSTLQSAKDHQTFEQALDMVGVQWQCLGFEKVEHSLIRRMEALLDRFFTKKPVTDQDTELLFAAIEFITDNVSGFEKDWIVLRFLNGFQLFSFLDLSDSKAFWTVKSLHDRISLLVPGLPSEMNEPLPDTCLPLALILLLMPSLERFESPDLMRALTVLASHESDSSSQVITVLYAMRKCMMAIAARDEFRYVEESVIETVTQFWHHSNTFVRLLALETCASIVSSCQSGSCRLINVPGLWPTLWELTFSEADPVDARCQGAIMIKNLITLSSETRWLGPVVEESISRLQIEGPPALALFCIEKELGLCMESIVKTRDSIHHKLIGDVMEMLQVFLTTAPGCIKEFGSLCTMVLDWFSFSFGDTDSTGPSPVLMRRTLGLMSTIMFNLDGTESTLTDTELPKWKNLFALADEFSNSTSNIMFKEHCIALIALANVASKVDLQLLVGRHSTRILRSSCAPSFAWNEEVAVLVSTLIISLSMWSANDIVLKKLQRHTDNIMRPLARKLCLFLKNSKVFKEASEALGFLFILNCQTQDEVMDDLVETSDVIIAKTLTSLNSDLQEPLKLRLLSKLETLMAVLTNFCYKNAKTKSFLSKSAVSNRLHELSAIAFARPRSSFFPAFLTFLITGSSWSAQFRQALVRNNSPNGSKLKSFESVMAFVIEMLKLKEIRPEVKELLIVMLQTPEARKMLYRGGLIFHLLEQVTHNRYTKASKQTRMVLLLDILLTTTSYHDGRVHAAQSEILDNFLLDQFHRSSKLDPNVTMICICSILRNVTFLSSNTARLLNTPDYLQFLKETVNTSALIEFGLQSIWFLLSSSAKAIKVLQKAGISDQIQQRMPSPDLQDKTYLPLIVQALRL